MARKIFITGTDTGVGKTYISIKLLKQFSAAGFSTLGIKPIASDSKIINGKLLNADALALSAASSVNAHYDVINPFTFEPAIAPHIAANLVGTPLNLRTLNEKLIPALNTDADITIIEGAGGWLLPLNQHETLADYVIQQNFEIILVVGMRLGCLNHALLTERTILANGGKLIGWIANCLDFNLEYLEENISFLKRTLLTPYIQRFEYLPLK